jgi:bis(5'-nucleosyl)-tetraphosphatase (symmetrical)
MPWFAVPSIRAAEVRVLCGHWSALGEYRAAGVWGLDAGCVWGGELLALRLEDQQVFRQPSLEVRV